MTTTKMTMNLNLNPERRAILRAARAGLLPMLPADEREVQAARLDAEAAADEAAAARALAAAAEAAAAHAGRVARLLDAADTTRPR
jgi:hypothetical protein